MFLNGPFILYLFQHPFNTSRVINSSSPHSVPISKNGAADVSSSFMSAITNLATALGSPSSRGTIDQQLSTSRRHLLEHSRAREPSPFAYNSASTPVRSRLSPGSAQATTGRRPASLPTHTSGSSTTLLSGMGAAAPIRLNFSHSESEHLPLPRSLRPASSPADYIITGSSIIH